MTNVHFKFRRLIHCLRWTYRLCVAMKRNQYEKDSSQEQTNRTARSYVLLVA